MQQIKLYKEEVLIRITIFQDSGANAGGHSSDSEGEEQEDPSSSLHNEAEVNDAVAQLNIQEQVCTDFRWLAFTAYIIFVICNIIFF